MISRFLFYKENTIEIKRFSSVYLLQLRSNLTELFCLLLYKKCELLYQVSYYYTNNETNLFVPVQNPNNFIQQNNQQQTSVLILINKLIYLELRLRIKAQVAFNNKSLKKKFNMRPLINYQSNRTLDKIT